jgi:hypothetical protein
MRAAWASLTAALLAYSGIGQWRRWEGVSESVRAQSNAEGREMRPLRRTRARTRPGGSVGSPRTAIKRHWGSGTEHLEARHPPKRESTKSAIGRRV